MKAIDETRIAAIRVINKVITLKANVANGCYSDRPEMEKESKRLEGIKAWAIANDQIQEIRHYFASHNFGQNNQFAAAEIAQFFNH